jgi:hypothetical protein
VVLKIYGVLFKQFFFIFLIFDVIIGVFLLITKPEIVSTFFINIFKKTGLYPILMKIKRLFGR